MKYRTDMQTEMNKDKEKKKREKKEKGKQKKITHVNGNNLPAEHWKTPRS